MALAAAFLLSACGGAGSVKSRPDARSARTPVPVSASIQGDFNKALALMKKGAYREAIPELEAILARNDKLPGAQINLAIACMNVETDSKEARDANMKKAGQALQIAVETNPGDPVAHHQLGLYYRKTGRFEDARKAYERAILLQPNYQMAHLNMGILCDIYLQQPECAITHFEEYLKLAPDEGEKVSLWLADVRQRAGIPAPATASEVKP
jgi:tetratricopeptide (TPR) repeat protein